MPPRPKHNHRPLTGPETRTTPPAAAFAHVGGATVLVLSYLALIPGFLAAFILAAVLGLVLLVPLLAIATASWLLLLPVVALRRLARHPRHSTVARDSAAQRAGSRPATGAPAERSPAQGGQDAALRKAMKKQIVERSVNRLVTSGTSRPSSSPER